MRFFRTPALLIQIFPQVLWKYPHNNPHVFLTFDDGPDDIFTPQILDILETEKVVATFFVLGFKAQCDAAIVQRISQQGHSIGIHACTHQRLYFQSRHFIYRDILNSKRIVESIVGEPVQFFRPPFGFFSFTMLRICRLLNLRLVNWSLMSYDFDLKLSDNFILQLIKQQARTGDIIVFHDGHFYSERTVRILASVIKILKEKGFQFGRIM